jgi:sec-independent protein translocase protein TatA
MFLNRISAPEIIFIGLIVILLFGAKKLPEITKSFAQSIKGFKKEMKDVKDSVMDEAKEAETPPVEPIEKK